MIFEYMDRHIVQYEIIRFRFSTFLLSTVFGNYSNALRRSNKKAVKYKNCIFNATVKDKIGSFVPQRKRPNTSIHVSILILYIYSANCVH